MVMGADAKLPASLFAASRKVAIEIFAAADPLAIDEYLGRGFDSLLGLETVHLLARGQDTIIHLEARGLEHLLGPDAERAGVIREHHSVQRRGFGIAQAGISNIHEVHSDAAARRFRPARRGARLRRFGSIALTPGTKVATSHLYS
jgi:hypothetical protein